MSLKHSPNVKLPDIKREKDQLTRGIFDQILRLLYSSFKNIYDDLRHGHDHDGEDSDNVDIDNVTVDNIANDQYLTVVNEVIVGTDIFWIYNTETDYLECIINGAKRMEM